MPIQLKHAREAASPLDGARVLVDRLWPRGQSKVHLALTDWRKDVAPSAELRRCDRAHDTQAGARAAARCTRHLALG
jgi:uncharacterized protein YeaO (DUF488 family)